MKVNRRLAFFNSQGRISAIFPVAIRQMTISRSERNALSLLPPPLPPTNWRMTSVDCINARVEILPISRKPELHELFSHIEIFSPR